MGKKKKVKNLNRPSKNVENGTKVGEDKIKFIFSDFKIESICINKFSNYYKDEKHFNSIMGNLLSNTLKNLSTLTEKQIKSDERIQDIYNIHKITKRDILEDILIEYKYSDNFIDQLEEGDNIWQFKIDDGKYQGARGVFQLIGSVASLLFIDVNHNIYANKKMIKKNQQTYHRVCPKNFIEKCDQMKYYNKCYVWEYLDDDKLLNDSKYSYCYK